MDFLRYQYFDKSLPSVEMTFTVDDISTFQELITNELLKKE